MRRIALALVALALLAPAASAHCAELPRPQDTRLLEDVNDECQVSGGTNDCDGSDELIALDIQERWDGTRNVAVFRFIMDKGAAGNHKDTLTFSGPKGPATLSIQSTDGTHYTNGGGFDFVSGSTPTGDGSRFIVEGSIALDKLGGIGETLSAFKVTADGGDVMPGSCHNSVGDCINTSTSCTYNPTTPYKLRAASYYTTFTAGTLDAVAAGAEGFAQLSVKNNLDTAQQATLTLSAPSGVSAAFHSPDAAHGDAHEATTTFALANRATHGTHLAVTGTAPTRGVITVTLTTDLGGRNVIEVPFEIVGGGNTSSSGPHGSSSSAKGSPAFELPLAVLAMAAIAMARRRGKQ